MAIEYTGPGGISNSYGGRNTRQPSRIADANKPHPFYWGMAVTPQPIVLGAPSQVAMDQARVRGTSARVFYSAPLSEGASAITGYTATSSPGGLTGSVSGSKPTPIAVNGLIPGTFYTFTVVANNAQGSSTPSAASNAVSASIPVVTPTLRQVASRSTYPTAKLGGTAYLFHSTHQVFEDQSKLQIIYSGRHTQLETAQDNGVSAMLDIEYPVGSGTIIASMTFGGNTLFTSTSAGQDIVTDMVNLSTVIPAGAKFRIKGAMNAPFGPLITTLGSMPILGNQLDLLTNTGVTSGTVFTLLKEPSATWNARTSSNGNFTYAILPAAILGMGTIPAIFVTGDSRSAGGSADIPDTLDGLAGNALRLIGKAYPAINTAQSGEKASGWVNGTQGIHRRTFAAYCQGAFLLHGTNDVPTETSAANLIALDSSMISLITTAMGANPSPLMTATLPPNTGDITARWDTLTSQNPATNFAFRNALNADRLSKQGTVFNKVFDVNPLVITPGNPDKWAISPVARTLAVTTTAGSNVFTVTTGTLTPADDGAIMKIIGSGSSGSNVNYCVEYVSSTSGKLRPEGSLGYNNGVRVNQNAVTAVTDAAAYIGMWYHTNDGIHENLRAGQAISTIGLTARL